MKPDMRWFFFGISGRISRLPYLLGIVFILVIGLAILNELIVSAVGSDRQGFWQAIIWIYAIVSQWMTVVLAVKRLHDFNRPGLIAIVLFVPFVSALALILLCLVPGTPGPNAYGNRTDRPKS